MPKKNILLAMTLLTICYYLNAIVNHTPEKPIDLFESANHTCQQQFDSIPICQKPCYDEIMEFLLFDPTAKKAFSILSKKNNKNGSKKLKIKVSKKVYPLSFSKKDTICQPDTSINQNECRETGTFELSSYSTAANRY